MPEFYMIFDPKMLKFYIFAPKLFFQIFKELYLCLLRL